MYELKFNTIQVITRKLNHIGKSCNSDLPSWNTQDILLIINYDKLWHSQLFEIQLQKWLLSPQHLNLSESIIIFEHLVLWSNLCGLQWQFIIELQQIHVLSHPSNSHYRYITSMVLCSEDTCTVTSFKYLYYINGTMFWVSPTQVKIRMVCF